ncbi:MAG: ISAs1 family transposase [Methylococcales bacterium]
MDIIILTICAVISGAEGWEAIEQFGNEKQDWLRKWIALENGIPSHDCMARVIARIEPSKLTECFVAWASQVGLSLGQVKTAEKSNEITAIPALLELLEVKGCIITIDAMGCQTDIAKKIIEKQADTVLAVKDNQKQLHEAIRDYFEVARVANQPALCQLQVHENINENVLKPL